VRVFLQSVVAQLLLNPYVWWRGRQAFPQAKGWRTAFTACFVVEILTYFTGFFFYKDLPDGVMKFILYYCGTWYIGLLYATMALLVLELLALSNRLYPWFPKWILRHWVRTKVCLFFLITIGLGGLLCHAYNTVAHPLVKHVNIRLPKGELNRTDSLKIVMMSDLHIGEMVGKDWVRRYVSLSNAQQPDLVVLVGDLLDYESRHAENEHIEDDLQQLNAPLGVYAINGNHEYRANRHAKRRWIEKTGIRLLVDSVVLIDHSFYLVGRDDFINKERQPLQALLKGVETGRPVIVLDHQPWSLAELAMNGVDLGLHGHTHYGQLWPYPLLMKFIYECAYGSYRKGDTQFYVSSGIGIAGPPYRVGTVSELVVLHITFE
jgi:predicted MPP superfamily phosphohydrolase